MCFSLPESNSFPGPRQLHINWPRRRCQGYSAQVLWRCHRQLNIDLEVCSYSLYLPDSLSLSCMLSPISFCISLVPAFLPILSMRNCLCSAFSQAHIHTHTHTHNLTLFILLLLMSPFGDLSFISFFSSSSYLLDVSSLLSVFSLLFPPCVSLTSSFRQKYIKQGLHSRPELVETSTLQEFHWGQLSRAWAGEAPWDLVLPSPFPSSNVWEQEGENFSSLSWGVIIS